MTRQVTAGGHQSVAGRMLKCLLVLLISIHGQGFASANLRRSVVFTNLGLEDGLSQGYVTCILQDSQGLMWFGTADGLNRFDGYDFEVFRYRPFEPYTLSNNYIHSIFEDQLGIIWVGTRSGGLNRFDRRTGRFTHFQHDPDNPASIGDDMVFGIYAFPDRPNELWIGTNSGLDKLILTGNEDEHPEEVVFLHYKHDPEDFGSLSSNYVRYLYGDRSGTLWVATWDGLNLLEPGSDTFIRFIHAHDDPTSISDSAITVIYQDMNDRIWIGTYLGGLNLFDPQRKGFIHYQHTGDDANSLSSDTVMTILQDSRGSLWIGTPNGLDRLDPRTATFAHFRHDPADSSSLSQNGIVSLFESPSGIIWIGTDTGGISRFSPTQEAFAHINESTEPPLSMTNSSTYAIYESPAQPGIVWIGTDLGTLHRLDLEQQTVTPYPVSPASDPLSSSVHIRAISSGGASGDLWLACTNGLKRFTPETGEIHHYRHDPDDPSSMDEIELILCLYNDEPDTLWVGHDYCGLSRLDIPTERFFHYDHDPHNQESLSNGTINCLTRSHTGLLWVGTLDGLNYFDPDRMRSTRFYHDPHDPNSLSSSNIKSVYEDRHHTVWVGTDGGGLNRLAWSDSDDFGIDPPQVRYYLEKDGLPNSVVYGILPDDNDFLWLSTNHGLSRFSPETGSFRNFDTSDGLQSNEFNTGAYWKTGDGRLFFGGVNGLNYFDPDTIFSNSHVPPILFTDFQLFNESVDHGADSPLQSTIQVTESIDLRYDQDVFSFEFVALDFTEPQKNQYSYKLEGFEDSWNMIGTRRFITFTNLPAGDFILHVRGSNNDGIWNERGRSIAIHISPPWWKTPWAYLLYLATGVVVILAGVRLKLNRERMKNQLQLERMAAKSWLELDRLKSRFFANVSHELRTPLTLILGPMQQLLDSGAQDDLKSTAELVIRNAEQLLSLVNKLLELSKLEAGKLDLQISKQDIVPLVKGFLFAFESLAQSRGISLCFVSDLDTLRIYCDAEKLEKVFNNLLSNAFKFTPDGGEIRLEMTLEDDELRISVFNSGLGISAEHLPHVFDRFYSAGTARAGSFGSGIGLALAKELVELHHGSISASSQEGQWAELSIRLPIGDDVFSANERTEEILTEAVLPAVEPVRAETTSDEPAGECDSEGTIVLIVEDNQDMRAYIADVLSKVAEIVHASDGAEGFRKATELIPTLIVSDVMMPEMDGFQLVEKLKNDERTGHIPVILLTARSSMESKVEGLTLGADDYLVKPFDSSELKVRVSNLIEQRRQLRQRFSREITLQPSDIAITPADEVFLDRLITVIETRLDDPELSVEWLSREIGLSRSQLHRKLHGLVDQSASTFIRSIRLKRAAKLLEAKAATVSEIVYQVGFSSPTYFRKCFRDQFGVVPSEYRSRS